MTIEDKKFSVLEAAAYIGVSRSKMYQYRDQHVIASHRHPSYPGSEKGKIFFYESDLKEYLRQIRQPSYREQ